MFATRSRYSISLIAATLLTSGLFLATPTAAVASESGSIYSLTNQARWDNGQKGLVRNAAMDEVALAWAETMAANGTMSHNPNYASQVPSGWSRVGENVAKGHATGSAMHEGWMSSAGHRANILGDYTDIGIAFIERGGTTWGVQVFAKYAGHTGPSAPVATTPTPEPSTEPEPAPEPVTSPSPTPDASPAPVPSPTPVASPDPVTSPAPVQSPVPTSSASPVPTAPGGNSTASPSPAKRSPASAAAARAMQVPVKAPGLTKLETLPFSPLEEKRAEPAQTRPGTPPAALAVPGSSASGTALAATSYAGADGLLPLGTGLAAVLAVVAALLASRRTLFPQGRHRG